MPGLSFSTPQMSECSPQAFPSLLIYDTRTQAGISSAIISVRRRGESSSLCSASTPERGTDGKQLEHRYLGRGVPTFSSCFRNATPHHNPHGVAASQEKPQKGNIIKKVSTRWGELFPPLSPTAPRLLFSIVEQDVTGLPSAAPSPAN